MHANDTNGTNKIIYPKLSYSVTGICFNEHNDLGRYSRERQYGDAIEHSLNEDPIPYKREFRVGGTGNIIDFLIVDKIVL